MNYLFRNQVSVGEFFPFDNFLKIIFQTSYTGNGGIQNMFFISHLNANEN